MKGLKLANPDRRTTTLGVLLVLVAAGAAAARVASGADAPESAPVRPAHHGPRHAPTRHPPNATPPAITPAATKATPNARPMAPNVTPDVMPNARSVAPNGSAAAPPPAPVHRPRPGLVVADTVVVERETFGYAGAARRDPFRPLIVTAALRPLPSELRLVAVAYDPTGIGSVAILRDATTKAQHRVRVGQAVGRMRVLRIRPRTVVFSVDELGFSRTETVTLSDSVSNKPQP